MLYLNKLENRIAFKIKTGCYVELFNAWNNEIAWKN